MDTPLLAKGEQTRITILNAATEIFIVKGFDGTAMLDIAKQAGVNSALLYHYFDNKKNLWKAVKGHIFNQCHTLPPTHVATNLEEFITTIVNHHMRLYQNPTVRRLLQWQQLENDETLQGTTDFSPKLWTTHISKLQQRQLIRHDWPAEAIKILIHSMTCGALLNHVNTFAKHPKKLQQYQNIITTSLMQLLAPPSR